MKTAIYIGKNKKTNTFVCPNCKNKILKKKSFFSRKQKCPRCETNLIFTKFSGSGFAKGFCLSMILFILLITSIFIVPILSSKLTLGDKILDESFKYTSNTWQNTEISESLAYLCDLNEDDEEKIYCVYNFINDNTKYGITRNLDKVSNSLNKPEDIFSKPSLCRDVSVLAKSIFDNMGIENEFVLEPNHVYNKVFLNNKTYIVDIAKNKFKNGN